jgi:hypothetical protein
MKAVLTILLALPVYASAQTHLFRKALFHGTSEDNVDRSGACVESGTALETGVTVHGYVDSPTLRIMYRHSCAESR